jgi:hypothetical protein
MISNSANKMQEVLDWSTKSNLASFQYVLAKIDLLNLLNGIHFFFIDKSIKINGMFDKDSL